MQMDIKIKEKKLKLIKKYTDPKLVDIVKRMNTTRSAFYKGYINDEAVNKMFDQVYTELECLLNEFKTLKEEEEISEYMKTHKKEILSRFSDRYILKEEFRKEVKEMIKQSKKNNY